MRGATATSATVFTFVIISIHAPHAGRDLLAFFIFVCSFFISIHAPHAGRDPFKNIWEPTQERFQSTRPMRGATFLFRLCWLRRGHFNPRAPCGARRANDDNSGVQVDNFNPRAPCGARLSYFVFVGYVVVISIHAPHAGRDGGIKKMYTYYETFQSTRPMRGATKRIAEPIHNVSISIHAPHAGRDRQNRR